MGDPPWVYGFVSAPARRWALVGLLVAGVAAGCGSHERHTPTSATGSAPGSPRPRQRTVIRLEVVGRGRLPAPVQLPGMASTSDGRVVAVGGLDAADTSTATITRVLPGTARAVGALPQAAHDIGVTALGPTVYAFGGGTAAGPTSAITAIGRGGGARSAGRLPVAMSDTTAVAVGGTAYVIGGFTATTPLRSVLAFRPGHAVAQVASLPHPVRYAAAAAVGGRIYVAGGTTGTHAWRDVVAVNPRTHRARVVARLPSPLAHAAGAALDGRFYILGGRGDGLGSQRSAIWAFDPRTRELRRAGRLPLALSDLAAATDGRRLVVAGGRDRAGRVLAERWLLQPASVAPHAARRGLVAGRIAPLLDRRDVYAADRRGLLAPAARGVPSRVYVPNSISNTVDVISQRTGRVISSFPVPREPQHVTPSWDLRTLWVTSDEGNRLTPIDPRTSRPGRPIPVTDPYNLYFTADGRRAIVVAERMRELDFRTPHTMQLRHALHVPMCPGVDHMDFTADGRRALVSCEFGGAMIVVDLVHERVLKTIPLRPGAMPQDVKLSPDGRVFYVADMMDNGVWLIDAHHMRKIGFEHTGLGAHGLYPSRDATTLYVSNRGEGSITLISFRTRRPYRKWQLPGGGSPDMGGVSASGGVLWLSGRYNSVVYAISTRTGRLLHRIPVGSGPHGMAVWPQPGRYSIGHTGILR